MVPRASPAHGGALGTAAQHHSARVQRNPRSPANTQTGFQTGQGKQAAGFNKMWLQTHCSWMENWTQGQILLLFAVSLQQVLKKHKARPDCKTAHNWDPTSVRNKLWYLHELAIQRKHDILLLDYTYSPRAKKQQESENFRSSCGSTCWCNHLQTWSSKTPQCFFLALLKNLLWASYIFRVSILFQSYKNLVLTIIPSVFLQPLVPSADSSVLFLITHYSKCHCTLSLSNHVSQFQFPYCYTFNRKRWRIFLCLGFLCCFDFCKAGSRLTLFKEFSLQ